MRSSSIKSFAATLTLAAVVSTAVAVNLQARPATRNANETVVSVRDTATSYDRASAAVRRLVRRFFGPVTNVLPTIPIPGEPPTQAITTTSTN